MSGEAARLTVGEALSGGGIVTLAGMLTVFAILVALVFVTKLIGLAGKSRSKSPTSESASPVPTVQPVPQMAPSAPLANRGEVIAAVSAAIAQTMGTEPSGIRIHSFRAIGASAPPGRQSRTGRRYFCGDCHSHGHRRHRPSDSFYQANRIIPSHKIICAEEYYYA